MFFSAFRIRLKQINFYSGVNKAEIDDEIQIFRSGKL